jgi:hypothetical protein
MTFLTLQQELQDRLGVFDQTVSTDATKLKRWINMGIQYICGKRLWPFMLAEEIIQTITDYTTGTVTAAAASTSVTASATITDSKEGQYIQFASSNDWYKITAHTAGTAALTISPASISANTTATYTIRKLLYTTTTPLVQILDMKQLVTPVRIISQSPRGTDFFLPLYYSAGTPYYYTMSSPSSDGTPQFSFMLSPSSALNIMIRGIKNLTDLSADSDIPVIPANWHDSIVNIAAYYGFQSLDDNRSDSELKIGEMRITDMSRILTHDLGRHRVMQPVDGDWNSGLKWALPSNFGPDVS